MTDPDKVTLAECIDYATRVRGVLHGMANGNPRALPEPEQNARVMGAVLSHLRTLAGVEAGTHVVVEVIKIEVIIQVIEARTELFTNDDDLFGSLIDRLSLLLPAPVQEPPNER